MKKSYKNGTTGRSMCNVGETSGTTNSVSITRRVRHCTASYACGCAYHAYYACSAYAWYYFMRTGNYGRLVTASGRRCPTLTILGVQFVIFEVSLIGHACFIKDSHASTYEFMRTHDKQRISAVMRTSSCVSPVTFFYHARLREVHESDRKFPQRPHLNPIT